MNLIHFRGLNCYFNCAVSIAAHWGIPYEDAFATLWSETDFYYDPYNDVYSSREMLKNLAAMGAALKSLTGASQKDREAALRLCPEGEVMLIGMDAFEIPWSPIYQSLHDAHYFLVQKEIPSSFMAFDPTYGKGHLRITVREILPHAYDIWRIQKVEPVPLRMCAAQEARQVVRNHPGTLERVQGEILGCAGAGREGAAPLGKTIDALTNNRHLFKRYLQNRTHCPEECTAFFGQDYFSRWQAVKNGLYKAFVLPDNRGVLREVSRLFHDLLQEEMSMAERMAFLCRDR